MGNFLIKYLDQFVSGTGMQCGYAGIRVDSRGFPHMIYVRPVGGGSSKVVYSTYLGKDSGGWVDYAVAPATSLYLQFALIDLQVDGTPGIVWSYGTNSLFANNTMYYQVRTGAYNQWSSTSLVRQTGTVAWNSYTTAFFTPPHFTYHKYNVGVWVAGDIEMPCGWSEGSMGGFDIRYYHQFYGVASGGWQPSPLTSPPWLSTTYSGAFTGIIGAYQKKKHITMPQQSTGYPYFVSMANGIRMDFYAGGGGFMSSPEDIVSSGQSAPDCLNATFDNDGYLIVVYSRGGSLYMATRKNQTHTPVGPTNYDVVTIDSSACNPKFLTVKVDSNNNVIIGATNSGSSGTS